MQCSVVQCSIVQYIAVKYGRVQALGKVQCSVQGSRVQCSVEQMADTVASEITVRQDPGNNGKQWSKLAPDKGPRGVK